jgi:hypothetical protein
MKPFFSRHYHLVLLGAAVLISLGCVIFLIIDSPRLESLLKNHPGDKSTGRFSAEANGDSTKALARLKNPPSWIARQDGASPFVSRPYLLKEDKLVDPMEGNQPLYPPVPNQWLIDHHLDFTDRNILDRDPLHKGFTVREEFEAGTDPNNPTQFPPLYAKLSYQESGVNKSSYILEFLGEENVLDDNGVMARKIQIKPFQPMPNPAKGNRPDTSVRSMSRGETVPGAPFLKVVDIVDRKQSINDTEYDVSELKLLNTLTGERIVLVKKNSSKEYRKTPVELIESIQFLYQLSGGSPEAVTVQRGKEFTLTSLDKTHSETYKLVDVSKDGAVLEKDGKSCILKPGPAPSPSPTPSSTP